MSNFQCGLNADHTTSGQSELIAALEYENHKAHKAHKAMHLRRREPIATCVAGAWFCRRVRCRSGRAGRVSEQPETCANQKPTETITIATPLFAKPSERVKSDKQWCDSFPSTATAG